MKNFRSIAWRLIKVIYVLLLLSGLLVVLIVWKASSSSYQTYSYKVICDNGKTFDPTSKPIDKIGYSDPFEFNENQIKSECKYGTTWYKGWSEELSKNFQLDVKHIVRTQKDQIITTVIAFILYYLVLELLRRTFLYVVFGKNFLTLKSN